MVRVQPPADSGDAPVTGYQVQRSPANSDNWVTVTVTPVTDLEFVAKPLSPGSRYQFRVAAENEFGLGKFGPPSLYVTTDESVCIGLFFLFIIQEPLYKHGEQ